MQQRTFSRFQADVMLLAAAFIWGMAFVPQKTAMDAMEPFTFVAARFALSALIIAPLALWEMRRHSARLNAGDFWLSVAVGTALFAALSLQQIGMVSTTVTNAGFLTSLYVCFTPLIVWAIFKVRPTRAVWVSVPMCIAGVWLLGGGSLSALNTGDYLILASTGATAMQIVLVGYAIGRLPSPFLLALIQCTVCAVLCLPGALIVEHPSLAAVYAGWPEVFVAGIASGGIAYTLQLVGQRCTPASDAAIIFSSEAIFAALAGRVVLGDSLTPLAWLGCGLILCGILLVGLFPSPALPYRNARSEKRGCDAECE